MKHLAALIALPLAALAVPAYAVEESPASNNDSATVNVTGNVANLCILGDPSLPNVDVGQMVNTSGAQVGKIATIGNQVVNLPNSFCNFAGTQVGVTTSALLGPAGTPPASFSRAVNYTATASGWAAANAAATSGAAFDGSTPTLAGCTTSATAIMASYIGMSTWQPTPVRSRWRSAASVPMTA